MSDLATNLLSQYYGLGEKSHNKRFLSVHECIENVKTDEDELILERKSTITNEQNFSEDKYSQKDISDCDNVEFMNDVPEKSSEINEADDEDDTTGEIDDYDFSRSIINNEFESSQASLYNVSPNTGKAISKLLDTENIDGNDLSISNCEDSIPDNISDVSSANILKTPKKLAETCISKEPVLNEIFVDFSNVGLSTFSMEVLEKFSEIRMLYLESNNLAELPDELFPTLRHLEWLDVRNNQLTTIPINIKHHSTLTTILLDGNRIEKLPLELCLLPKLKTLHVTQNPLIVPPQDIVNLGCKSILNFLRNEWNKVHPDQIVKFEEKKIEAKPSTILCYNSPRKTKKRPRTVQSMSAETVSARRKSIPYKPGNRCVSAGADISKEQYLLWISKAKEALNKQESVLQQIKDENVLKGWRRDKRSFGKSTEKAKNRNEADIPFAINFEEYASILKRNPNSQNRKNTRKKTKTEFIPPSNINKKFGELLDALNKLCISKSDIELTPRTKQKAVKQEIEKILQFQEDINNLKKYNNAVIAPFPRRM